VDNYEVSRDRAQQYFLNFDQEKLLNTWHLRHDDAYIYTDFLGQSYRICRATGAVCREKDGKQADFNAVLSVFDLLCHESGEKIVTGRFAPVNSLKGNTAVGVATDFHTPFAAHIDRDPEAFRHACERLGGKSVDMGDIGYRFPIFADLDVILKFYHSDEDFPASVTLLWEENMLQFVYYETVFYIAGALLRQLEGEM
jgi:hypothetical protein